MAASPSDLRLLLGPSTASRLRGSLASSVRRAASSCRAPFCHASESATTWSICTSELVSCPAVKAMVTPVYGLSREPAATVQPCVPGFTSIPVRSRRSTSLRVSQPLWSVSAQRGPNSSRE